MTTLFLTVAEQSLRLSGIILCLWGLRAIFRKIPGSAWYLLWILIFVGLLLPLRVEVPYHTEAPVLSPAAVVAVFQIKEIRSAAALRRVFQLIKQSAAIQTGHIPVVLRNDNSHRHIHRICG